MEKADQSKPRTRFCWHCCRKLQGNHYAEYESENGTVIVHKACKKELETGHRVVKSVDDADYED